MKAWEVYFSEMSKVVDQVVERNKESIDKAAKICADTSKKGGLIYAYGCGHSHLVADDGFWRAAMPANYVALLEASASGNQETTKSYLIENTYDVGKAIVDYHRITPNDCLIVISNSGNNIAPVDAALRAKEKGIPVIAICSVDYANQLTTKHKCGKKLKDIADVVLDNCCMYGDAVVPIEGFLMKVGACSTIPQIYLQTAMLCQMAEILVQEGFTPDFYYNGHLCNEDPNLARHNDEMVDKYFYRIKNL